MQTGLGKLFIGGISWETNEERLKEYFSNFGDIVEAVIMKDRTTGRARGFGFVVFADSNVAERVTKEKHNIDGRMVEAKKAVPRDDQSILSRNTLSSYRKIFVGGLASTVTENDFKKYFEQFGTITDAVVMYDHTTNRPRGFGFITYDSEEAVDKALSKTFHELNSKMVEVKRAVPKERSPGPIHSPVVGYNNGLNRVSNFLGGFTPGFIQSGLGGYGIRMDGRFNTVASGRSGLTPFGAGYRMGLNFEPGLGSSYGGNTSFRNSNSFGREVNPYFLGSSNRFVNPLVYDSANSCRSSTFSSTAAKNLWENGGLIDGTDFLNSNLVFKNNVGWGISAGRGAGNPSINVGNFRYGATDGGYTLGRGSYGRNDISNVVVTTSSEFDSPLDGGYEGAISELYGSASIYSGSTWRSATPGRDESSTFGYGLGNAGSDPSAKVPAGFVGGYRVNKGLPNRGLKA